MISPEQRNVTSDMACSHPATHSGRKCSKQSEWTTDNDSKWAFPPGEPGSPGTPTQHELMGAEASGNLHLHLTGFLQNRVLWATTVCSHAFPCRKPPAPPLSRPKNQN